MKRVGSTKSIQELLSEIADKIAATGPAHGTEDEVASGIAARRYAFERSVPERLAEATFATWDSDPPGARKLLDVGRDYAESFPPSDGGGLFLFGEPGGGKSHMLVAIGRAVAARGFGVRLLNASEYVEAIRRAVTEDGGPPDIPRHDLLLLDDIGAEKPTETVAERLYLVIDRRYRHALPTVYASNLTLDDLSERLHDRVASRIAGTCREVRVDYDYRNGSWG